MDGDLVLTFEQKANQKVFSCSEQVFGVSENEIDQIRPDFYALDVYFPRLTLKLKWLSGSNFKLYWFAESFKKIESAIDVLQNSVFRKCATKFQT